MDATYLALIKPVPDRLNLSNISALPPCLPCEHCRLLFPDRGQAKNGLIKTAYQRFDRYPEFPGLKASAKSRCDLCRLIRKAIRATWARRPMEEMSVGPLSERESMWYDLLDSPWDCQVKIWGASFVFTPFSISVEGPDQKGRSESNSSPEDSAGSILAHLSMTSSEQDQKCRDTEGNTSAASTEDDAMLSDLRAGGSITHLNMLFGPGTTAHDETGHELHGEISQSLSFVVFDSLDLRSTNIDTQRRLPSLWTLSDENVRLIKHWVNKCSLTHSGCSQSLSWFPTRLLDIGADFLNPAPVLVETVKWKDENPGRSIKYVALSHMWGDMFVSPPLKALQSNYNKMRQEIRMLDLPQNFTDAIWVCSSLGIRYLWIDSLCIIQDSPEDWKKEAATMHLVYSCSFITIVAASATSTHDGFLTRNISMTQAAKIKYSSDSQLGNQADAESNRYMIISPRDSDDKGFRYRDVQQSLWNTRGWTMQERSLSTRVLYFCYDKLYFECRGSLRSEENEPEEANQVRSRLWPRDITVGGEAKQKHAQELYREWLVAVAEYSRRALTHGTDKLVAIQSIAAEMERHVDDSYISFAGVWKREFRREILWHVSSLKFATRPLVYRAPSWSWAALDAQVSFGNGTLDPVRKDIGDLLAANELELIRIEDVGDSIKGARSQQIEVRGMTRAVHRIKKAVIENETPFSQRIYPFDLFVRSIEAMGELSSKDLVFAHGMLDMGNRDGLLNSEHQFLYLHVSHDEHPTGIILSLLQGQPPSQKQQLRERVGAATVFRTNGSPILDEPPSDGFQLKNVTIV